MISNRGEILKEIESKYLKDSVGNFSIGDTIKVYFKIKEGKRERLQAFEGVVIAINGTGIRKNITVRKISFNVGVERVFPLHSPKVEKIDLVRRGRVRRAKLYYLRKRRGKAAQVKRVLDKKSTDIKKANKAINADIKKEVREDVKAGEKESLSSSLDNKSKQK